MFDYFLAQIRLSLSVRITATAKYTNRLTRYRRDWSTHPSLRLFNVFASPLLYITAFVILLLTRLIDIY